MIVFFAIRMIVTFAIRICILYNVCMKVLSDRQLIAVARKYNLNPGDMKCKAFALFDQNYSRKEVRHLLRSFRDPQYPQRFSNTIGRYYFSWRKVQEVEHPKTS